MWSKNNAEEYFPLEAAGEISLCTKGEYFMKEENKDICSFGLRHVPLIGTGMDNDLQI